LTPADETIMLSQNVGHKLPNDAMQLKKKDISIAALKSLKTRVYAIVKRF
jgi:hypothetical protein